MRFDSLSTLLTHLSEEGGMIPLGGEASVGAHEMLIDNLPINDVLRVWDYLENKGIEINHFQNYSANLCAITVKHSNKVYLDDQIFDALIGEKDA